MIARHKEIINEICRVLKRRLKPRRIILFGSRAKGHASRHADFDFAVDRKRPKFSIERKIKEEIEAVGGLYKVDVVYLDSIEKEFKRLILGAGKVLYEKRD
jgi:predicted nucleotidyltransferase